MPTYGDAKYGEGTYGGDAAAAEAALITTRGIGRSAQAGPIVAEGLGHGVPAETGSATVTCAAISAVATCPSPSVSTPVDGVVVTPTVVEVSSFVHGYWTIVSGDGNVIGPAVILGAATLPTALISGAANATPAVISVIATVPAPATITNSTVTPGIITIQATIPRAELPKITAVVQGSVSVPTPSLAMTAQPASVLGVAGVNTVGIWAVVSPAVVPAAVTVPSSGLLTSVTVQPPVVTASATVQSVIVSDNEFPGAVTIVGSASVPTLTITTTATVSPGAVLPVASVPSIAVSTGPTAQPIAGTSTIGSPTILRTATATPATLVAGVLLPAPTLGVGWVVGVSVVSGGVSFTTPLIPVLPAVFTLVAALGDSVPAGDSYVQPRGRSRRPSARVGTIIGVDEKKPRFKLGSDKSLAHRKSFL